MNINTGEVLNKFSYLECKLQAEKWRNRSGFKLNDRAGYDYAKAMAWLNDISKDLGWKIPVGKRYLSSPKMTDDEIKKVGQEFKTRTELKVKNRNVYDIARVRNLLREMFN